MVEGVVFDEDDEAIMAFVRPRKGAKRRCGICQRRCLNRPLSRHVS
jgi:hypothetical protein